MSHTLSRTTRRGVLGGAAAIATVALPGRGWSQSWTKRTVRIIVPFAAGGSVDAMGRFVAEGLQKRLGGSFVVENRTGASGSIGTGEVVRSAPDGTTWLLTFDTHSVLPTLIKNLPFDVEKDLKPVSLIGTSPMLFATHPEKPFKSFQDFVALAKSGSRFTYGSGGPGTLAHLVMASVGREAGADLTHIAYRGGAPAINDAVAGHNDGFIGTVAILTPYIEGGLLRPIFQTGAARAPSLSTVPLLRDAGLRTPDAEAWWGVFAPAETPDALVEEFQSHLVAVFNEPDLRRKLVEGQQVSLKVSTPKEFAEFSSNQVRTWGPIARELGISPA